MVDGTSGTLTGTLGPLGTLADHEPQMLKFLDALADVPNVTLACKAAGIGRSTAYRWRDKWKSFKAAWDDAIQQGCDGLEKKAWDRAMDDSDKMLIFLLKAYRPEVFRDEVKHKHDHGQLTVVIDV